MVVDTPSRGVWELLTVGGRSFFLEREMLLKAFAWLPLDYIESMV
jgi:hypothetical protein